jgi:hypothetical protein
MMGYIPWIALGIALSYVIPLPGFRRPSRQRTVLVEPSPPVEQPTHVYKPAVPGVEYDRAGVAINSMPFVPRVPRRRTAWRDMLAYLVVTLGLCLLLGMIGRA